MQAHAIAFDACQLVTSLYALARGGAPERIVAVELALAAAANNALPFYQGLSFHGLEGARLLMDVALLAALLPVAIRANRYWPLWIAAVQLDTVALHGVRAFDPLLRASIYSAMVGKAAYPILILLALGTLRHRDREARAGAGEAAWIT